MFATFQFGNILSSSLPTNKLKIKIYVTKVTVHVVLNGCEIWFVVSVEKRNLKGGKSFFLYTVVTHNTNLCAMIV